MNLILARHGQTAENVLKVPSPDNSPVNDIGEKQIFYLANRLRLKDIDFIYCSPHKRTTQTAERIISSHQNEFELDKNYFLDDRLKDFAKEDYMNHLNLLKSFFQIVVQKHPRDAVLVVTSSSPIRVLTSYALNQPPERAFPQIPHQENTGLTEIIVGIGGTHYGTTCMNCTKHLD